MKKPYAAIEPKMGMEMVGGDINEKTMKKDT